jgi:hypothetical protein
MDEKKNLGKGLNLGPWGYKGDSKHYFLKKPLIIVWV